MIPTTLSTHKLSIRLLFWSCPLIGPNNYCIFSITPFAISSTWLLTSLVDLASFSALPLVLETSLQLSSKSIASRMHWFKSVWCFMYNVACIVLSKSPSKKTETNLCWVGRSACGHLIRYCRSLAAQSRTDSPFSCLNLSGDKTKTEDQIDSLCVDNVVGIILLHNVYRSLLIKKRKADRLYGVNLINAGETTPQKNAIIVSYSWENKP